MHRFNLLPGVAPEGALDALKHGDTSEKLRFWESQAAANGTVELFVNCEHAAVQKCTTVLRDKLRALLSPEIEANIAQEFLRIHLSLRKRIERMSTKKLSNMLIESAISAPPITAQQAAAHIETMRQWQKELGYEQEFSNHHMFGCIGEAVLENVLRNLEMNSSAEVFHLQDSSKGNPDNLLQKNWSLRHISSLNCELLHASSPRPRTEVDSVGLVEGKFPALFDATISINKILEKSNVNLHDICKKAFVDTPYVIDVYLGKQRRTYFLKDLQKWVAEVPLKKQVFRIAKDLGLSISQD